MWKKYFDDRFPEEMIDTDLTVYKSFYKTFCEIILLPIKELVRGSMKCRTALDILKVKGIDPNEEFLFIEIPQANAPKNGEKPPNLRSRLKTAMNTSIFPQEKWFHLNPKAPLI